MTEELNKNRRSHTGYGSTYRKASGKANDTGRTDEIDTILNGQVWKIKPDKDARTQHPCIWMQAGVVEFKNCNNYYDCTTCKYDRGMLQQVEKGKKINWQQAMARKSGLERVCRHSLTQRIGKRACAYDYQCQKCDFDQMFEDYMTPKTQSEPHASHTVKGFSVPEDYYFHQGHAWARIESGGYIRVGLDDFALKVLGQADAFDLPLMGKELDPGKPGWGLKRKDNHADILSPVGGVIMEVNANVREYPKMANEHPYSEGWLFLLHTPDIKKSIKALMADTETLNWMNEEVEKLESLVETVAGPLAADGGFIQEDVFGNLPEIGWNNLTRTFLKT